MVLGRLFSTIATRRLRLFTSSASMSSLASTVPVTSKLVLAVDSGSELSGWKGAWILEYLKKPRLE